jgi:putative oxidoreductase
MSRACNASRRRDTGRLAGRVVLGSYLAVHGAQKLFGAFGGHGLDATAVGFDSLGLTPGLQMATLAGASELAGGLLTVTGARIRSDRSRSQAR